MKRRIQILSFSVLISGYHSLDAQDIYILNPVTITASRIRHHTGGAYRQTEVLSSEELPRLPSGQIAELLRYVDGVTVQRRGADGVQADFSLRGSSFEQVVILVNGVRLNDPQTGHHNSDIPVSVWDIQRIEVVPGHASTLYGPDGCGGVIQIITKKPTGHGTRFNLNGGSNKTVAAYLSQGFRIIDTQNQFTIEKRRSDGFRPNTDYDVLTISQRTSWSDPRSTIDAYLGYTAKTFGAEGFYAPFPSREKTAAALARFAWTWSASQSIEIQSHVFGRRHTDHFILDHSRPDWYQNRHTATVWGADVQASFRLSETRFGAVSVETSIEGLNSSVLDKRERRRVAISSELSQRVSRMLMLHTGLRWDQQSQWGSQITPSIGFRLTLPMKVVWRSSAGGTYRSPTFTELYYQSPVNQGNPNLRPETGWSAETSLGWTNDPLSASVTIFVRHERDKIDWIAFQPGDPWQACNIGQVRVSGFSATVSARWHGAMWRCHYMALDREVTNPPNVTTKYIFRAPKHHITMVAELPMPWKIQQTICCTISDRIDQNITTVLDFAWRRPLGRMELTVDLTNCLNTTYCEIPGVPMPGRQILTGVRFEL